MLKTFKTSKPLIVLASAIFLCLFVFNTDPKELSAPYLLVPPLLIFLTLQTLASAALSTFTSLHKQKRRLVSGVIAGGPLVLLLLASLGQLTPRDTVLALLLTIGLAIYSAQATVGLHQNSS